MLYATDKVRPIGAEREQSCGCDTVRYAVTASVSGMLAEETAEVVIAHTLACFFPSTLVWLLDWSGDTRYERQREEYQACGKCGGRKAKLTTEKEHLRC